MTGDGETHNANGNITHISDGNGNDVYYYYDDLGQLIREDNAGFNRTYVYTYDNAGNRLSKKTYNYSPDTATASLGTVRLNTTYYYADNPEYEGWGDQLVGTSLSEYEITYDNVGNPLQYEIGGYLANLGWSGRRLTSIVEENYEYYYTYNDEGIRTSKTIDGVEYKFTLNGSQIVSQEWEDKLMIFFYDEKGTPIGYAYRTTSMTADTFYYYVFEKNLQGDIVAIYNTSGVRLVSYTYDAWGNVSVSTHNVSGTNAGAQYNPLCYRGYYYDEEVGLYYLNSRYYDPATGRFLNADGYLNANGDIVGFNMYAYCSNNPVMFTDPTGEFVLSTMLISAAIGLVVGVTSSVISQGVTKGWENINATQVVFDGVLGAVSGAVGGSGISAVGSMILGGSINFVGSVGSDLIANDGDWNKVNLLKATVMGAIGFGLGALGGAGAENVDSMCQSINAGKTWGSKAFASMSNSVSNQGASQLARQTSALYMSNAILGYKIEAVAFATIGIVTTSIAGTLWDLASARG